MSGVNIFPIPASADSSGVTTLLTRVTSAVSLQSTTSESGTDSTGTGTTVRQLVASSSTGIRRISFSGGADFSGAGAGTIGIYILTGAGGSEVTRAIGTLYSAALSQESFFVTVQINLPAATRVAWKYIGGAIAPAVYIGYTIEEA